MYAELLGSKFKPSRPLLCVHFARELEAFPHVAAVWTSLQDRGKFGAGVQRFSREGHIEVVGQSDLRRRMWRVENVWAVPHGLGGEVVC